MFVDTPDGVTVAALASETLGRPPGGWSLSAVPFLLNGQVGSMMMDTGAGVTAITSSFVKRAGLVIRPHDGARRYIRGATGGRVESPGVVDVCFSVQLMMDVGNDTLVNWDRQITLTGVWVLPDDESTPSPTHLYVSYADWRFDPRGAEPASPLALLAYLVFHGATLVASPRAPPAGTPLTRDTRVVLQRQVSPDLLPTAVAAYGPEGPTDAERQELRDRLSERFPPERRGTPEAEVLLDALVQRWKLFTKVNPADNREVVDFDIVGEPTQVSFRVPLSRKAGGPDALAGLHEWIERGICTKVDWATPAYGFVIVVPKPNGKFRVTINPTGVNSATRRIDPEGGYLPANMIREAQRAGRQRVAIAADMAEAFLTMLLGPTAQRLSTFSSPLGKVQFKTAYFGWHSFPAAFQRIIMERVVLPTLDEENRAVILAWIDDLCFAAPDAATCVSTFIKAADRILAIGGRLNLEKCHFLTTEVEWCGVELNLRSNEWRIARRRVATLLDIPVPRDHTALIHVLGILRYYYWGVKQQLEQRDRIAELAKLDVPGIILQKHWTADHTRIMRASLEAIVNGDWTLVHDPRLPVYVTSDAGGNTGYAIIAWQYDAHTGAIRPIAYFSKGWVDGQATWKPQVKECYAQYVAATSIVPEAFPFADIVLLTDNKNVAAEAKSDDLRVRRWQADIYATPCVRRGWIPGHWNSIADHASRAVVTDTTLPLTAEERFELYVYAFKTEGGSVAVSSLRADAEAFKPSAGAHVSADTLSSRTVM